VSVTSAGCVLWLEQSRPLFASVALATLAYQTWLVRRRPPHRRSTMMLTILWTSVVITAAVAAIWIGLSLRYW
jgi:hypothetical protein